jgi:hypothetical protein
MKKTIIDVIELIIATIVIIGCVVFGANMFMDSLQDDLENCTQIQALYDLDEAGAIDIRTSLVSSHGLFDTQYNCVYVDNNDTVHIVKMVVNSYVFDKYFAGKDI